MVNTPQAGLRGLQFLFTLLTLALVGAVIASAFAGNDSVINYAIFVSIFDMLVIIWGAAAAFNESFRMGFFLTIADALATLFTLIAGIALAARLGVHSCGNRNYVENNALTNGSHSPSKRCHELQAATAFYWFAFAAFAASLALGAMGGGGSFKGVGGIRKGGTVRSQV